MQKVKVELNLPEGNFTNEVFKFGQVDSGALMNIYTNWRTLCDDLNGVGARAVNLPEGLSETAFCIAKNVVRVTSSIPKANSSFDCYDPNGGRGNNRIQVKACSVLPDLTSFGPSSVWDRIFFVDFYRNGDWDGTFDIYEIETEMIYSYPVNREQTVLDQKLQGRRPRFSIYSGLIGNKIYKSKETYRITNKEIIQII